MIPPTAVVGFLVYLLAVPALLFLSAGTIAWPMGWLFVALFLGSIASSRIIAWRRRPDLLAERARFTQAEGMVPGDRLPAVFVGLVGPMLMVITAGLDHRFGWPPALPAWVQAAGGLAVTLGYGLAMAAALILRTHHEDTALQVGLPGYREYARSNRSRLIPGVW